MCFPGQLVELDYDVAEEIDHSIEGDADLRRSGTEKRSFLVKPHLHATAARRLVLAGFQPHTTTLRADIDHDTVNVFEVELARALWTRAAALRRRLLATRFAHLGKCSSKPAVNRFLGKPKPITVAARSERHASLCICLQQMTVVGTS